jgi:hypothetical protein
VRGIATGTLPVSRFAYYVGQDRFFLQAFARTYCVAAAKAPDWEGFEVFHARGRWSDRRTEAAPRLCGGVGGGSRGCRTGTGNAPLYGLPPRHRLGGGCGADSSRHVPLHEAVRFFGAKAGSRAAFQSTPMPAGFAPTAAKNSSIWPNSWKDWQTGMPQRCRWRTQPIATQCCASEISFRRRGNLKVGMALTGMGHGEDFKQYPMPDRPLR